ncbi:MAG: secondary thiamine-phosphate synthase enzyme YjbQ [Desulfurococcales archaeon]|nr:secondary thiamine-phosphate synthase enzyme YjbQ [Desulfurococcales archaeon]
MRVAHGRIRVVTNERFETLDITGRVQGWLESINGRSGIVTVYVPHTTATIAVNEAEPGLLNDIVDLLKQLTMPGSTRWKHNRIDNNAHAHLSNILVGHSAVIPVMDGRLVLGTWQRIIFIEMDGPRNRSVHLTFIGE